MPIASALKNQQLKRQSVPHFSFKEMCFSQQHLTLSPRQARSWKGNGTLVSIHKTTFDNQIHAKYHYRIKVHLRNFEITELFLFL